MGLDQVHLAAMLRPLGVRSRRARSEASGGAAVASYFLRDLESAALNNTHSDEVRDARDDVPDPPGPDGTLSDHRTSDDGELAAHGGELDGTQPPERDACSP